MALIPPFYPDCVVAIGTGDPGQERWVASGFLYGQFVSKVSEDESTYRVYLVSNRHVFEGLQRAILRFNPQTNEPAKQYDIILKADGSLLWTGNPNLAIDVAVIKINFDQLRKDAMQADMFRSDLHVANAQRMRELGITEGDFAYVMGFPMGLVGGARNAVIVRGGTIARIRDVLSKASSTFLVDATIFPGNSGGPVVSKPETVAIQGTKPQPASYLIGVVGSYMSYQDVAISQQTNRPRVVFEENSGLAVVFPVDYVEEAIAADLKAPGEKSLPERIATGNAQG